MDGWINKWLNGLDWIGWMVTREETRLCALKEKKTFS